ncbi:uncharacterized protein [Amphiura filiformis]|uniref:uncharacterized protein n=1 Tax=Amphiura filiformis TaxID=82378 RepID=UPI003B210074
MDLSQHIIAVFLLSLIYFLLSGGGLVYLYYHYYEQLHNLKEELNLQSPMGENSDLPTTAEVPVECLCSDNESSGETDDWGGDSSAWSSNNDNAEVTYCCTTNETQLKQLVDKWTQNSLNRLLPHASPSGNSRTLGSQGNVHGNLPPSALLLGKKTKKGNHRLPAPDPGGQTIITSWVRVVSNHRKGYVNGVQVTRGRLTISVEGYYLVYSKVNLDLDNDMSGSVFHNTVVENQQYRPEPENLMRSAAQICSSEDNIASHSSFHSGIYRLFDGDEVFVKVSSPRNAQTGFTFISKDSFFGIYLLGET